ncbi:MAG: DinB family protein [Dehalococcoidia bacterium]
MSRGGIELLLYVMDDAFESAGMHSLISNVRSVADGDWLWTPPGGNRTIFEIVEHVGECKYVYENHAFGDGSMRWDRPGSVPGVERDTAPAAIAEWLREGQRRLRERVAAMEDDAELLVMRRANWGQSYETRWLMNAMVQHDLYHGGEINHIRALRQGNDRWAYDAG